MIVGNREWMNRNGLVPSEDVDKKMMEEEERGRCITNKRGSKFRS